MKFKILFILSLIILTTSFSIYKKYKLNYPSNFPEPNYDFKNNPLSNDKIELGRVLFYDPILSKDSSISCASCHSPYNAFSHTDHALSHGINDQIGNRNAPALFNLAWNKLFMWDGAINHIDVQALSPISHPKEMGEDISNVVRKLNKSRFYISMFKANFGTDSITSKMILKVLAQFQLSLVSANSKYDKVKSKKQVFNEQEKKGYNLFLKHCNNCHTEPLFTNTSFASNVIPLDTVLNDFGRWNITKHQSDSLMFKIPSLRNLSFTYPYMHDGRFSKLSQVMNHYTNSIVPNSFSLNSLKEPIKLTSNQKTDLIAFLLTLNDTSFIKNEKYAFPHYILKKAAVK